MGEGPRGSNGACFTLHWISATPSATHNQIGPLWCWFPSGWACAHSRPLWVSATTSRVRLGVSPAAAPTPMGAFNQRSEALFPPLEPWVARSASLPTVRPVYLCASVGPRGATPRSACPGLHHSESGLLGLSVCECGVAGSASGQTACPFRRQSGSSHGHMSPLQPGACLRPSYRSGCMFLFYLLGVGLSALGFSVSSGCVRRRSVSTYAAILVLLELILKQTGNRAGFRLPALVCTLCCCRCYFCTRCK